MYNEIHCAYTCTALEYQTFFLFFFSVVPFSPINGPSLNIGQQFNLVSMLDWIRSMLWLYDVISGGHPAVRLGQMTFKIHTVWPTSKHPTLFTTTLSSSLGIFTLEILIVGKCCRHLWVLSPVFILYLDCSVFVVIQVLHLPSLFGTDYPRSFQG